MKLGVCRDQESSISTNKELQRSAENALKDGTQLNTSEPVFKGNTWGKEKNHLNMFGEMFPELKPSIE